MAESIEARAQRQLALGTTGQSSAPGAEFIRFPMNCSKELKPFLVVAERHGSTLKLLRNEVPASGGAPSGAAPSSTTLGAFRSFDSGTWRGCPHCGALDNPYGPRLFWICTTCQSRGRPAFNCSGSDTWGQYRCSCGVITTGPFTIQEVIEVHGSRTAPAAAPRLAALPAAVPPWSVPIATTRAPPPTFAPSMFAITPPKPAPKATPSGALQLPPWRR
jgi:hypothetical protein